MNLVIDDAVEVKIATKEEAESRRELGMFPLWDFRRTPIRDFPTCKLTTPRPNTSKRR